MLASKLTRRGVAKVLAASTLATSLSFSAFAGGHQVVDSIHFLIPGGAGGGWDGTARGTGEALTAAGLVGSASYENMSGGGGGKAIGYMIENADLKGIVTQRRFLPVINEALEGLDPLQALLVIEDGTDCVASQESIEYESALAQCSEARDFGPRSGKDLYIIYTGGTNWMPKGVMWRHEDVFFSGLQGGSPGGDPVESPEQLIEQGEPAEAICRAAAAAFIPRPTTTADYCG